MFTLTQIYKSEKEIVCDMSILPEVSKNKEIMPEEVNSDGIEGNSDLNKKVLFKSGMQKISDSNQPVIRCSVLSNPNPIRVSPIDGEPQRISLTVVISNVSNYSAKCEKIVFSMKIKTGSTELTEDSDGIGVQSSQGWSVCQSTSGVFVATPPVDGAIIDENKGIIFTFYNIKASRVVGVSPFEISIKLEDSETLLTQTLALNKFPPSFFFGDFRADSPLIENGSCAVLRWDGSPLANYTMIWGKKDDEKMDVSQQREWTSDALKCLTNFVLRADYQLDGGTVSHYLGLTVNVRNSDIKATNIECEYLKANTGYVVPNGGIIMWSGETPPVGWSLCDGSNGTPNLAGRFIVGYDSNDVDYNEIGKNGGEKKHLLSKDEMPAHTHGTGGPHKHTTSPVDTNHKHTFHFFKAGKGWKGDSKGDNLLVDRDDNKTASTEFAGTIHNHEIASSGDHTHASEGQGQEHENRPPYYVLAYIMKL